MGSLGHSCLVVEDSVLISDSVSLGDSESVLKALEPGMLGLKVPGINVLGVGEPKGGSGKEVLDVRDEGVVPGWDESLGTEELRVGQGWYGVLQA